MPAIGVNLSLLFAAVEATKGAGAPPPPPPPPPAGTLNFSVPANSGLLSAIL